MMIGIGMPMAQARGPVVAHRFCLPTGKRPPQPRGSGLAGASLEARPIGAVRLANSVRLPI